MINFEDWQKLEVRIGTIKAVERVSGADKLLRFEVDLGEEQVRQVVAGLAEYFDDLEVLLDRQVPVITNLESRIIRGLESQGMILVADAESPILLSPDKPVLPGTRLG
ncbi:methionine--tRNA ligase [Candidatus Berkelbacteria bacterium]|nr:methionine--tRNA ligase [Candidatus Berkelbacteria bacterium]